MITLLLMYYRIKVKYDIILWFIFLFDIVLEITGMLSILKFS